MPGQSSPKYLDHARLLRKLKRKYGNAFNFKVEVGMGGTSWEYPAGSEKLSEASERLQLVPGMAPDLTSTRMISSKIGVPEGLDMPKISMIPRRAASMVGLLQSPGMDDPYIISSADLQCIVFHLASCISSMEEIKQRLGVLSSQRCFRQPHLARPISVVSVLERSGVSDAWSIMESQITDCTTVRALPADSYNACDKGYRARLICLSQDNSFSRINVTQETIQEIVIHHGLSKSFLDVISSFYSRTLSVEESFSIPWQQYSNSEYLELMYIFKYPEHTGRPGSESWSIRQTALYHRIRRSDTQSTLVLITPYPETIAKRQIITWTNDLRSENILKQQILTPHRLLISSYIDNWRFYMRHFEDRIEELWLLMLNKGLTSKEGANAYSMGELSSIQKGLIPIAPLLRALLRIIDGLQSCEEARAEASVEQRMEWEQLLCRWGDTVHGLEANAQALQQKLAAATQLLTWILSYKSQSIAEQQSDRVLRLTTSTVDDSATVRVITVITLVFLSFTAVAAIMAMPLFYLDPNSKTLSISPSSWIYLAVAGPLTGLTMTYWRFSLSRKRKTRAKQLVQMQDLSGRADV